MPNAPSTSPPQSSAGPALHGRPPHDDCRLDWQQVFAASDDCLKLISLDGHIQAINGRGACLLSLADARSVLGQHWPDLWPSAMREVVADAVRRARQGEEVTFTGPCQSAEGRWHVWRVQVLPLWRQGQIDALWACSRLVSGAEPLAMLPWPAPSAEVIEVTSPTPIAQVYGRQGGVVALATANDALADQLAPTLLAADWLPLRVPRAAAMAPLLRRSVAEVLVIDPAWLPPQAADRAVLHCALSEHPMSVVHLPAIPHQPLELAHRRQFQLAGDVDGAALLRLVERAGVAQRAEQQFHRWRGELDGVRQRIRHPSLTRALDHWVSFRQGDGQIPDADRCDELVRPFAANAFIVSVQGEAGRPDAAFQFEWVGSELQRQAQVCLEGRSITGPDQPVTGALHRAYERALGGLPCLDWARLRLGAGRRFDLERLMLPLTTDGLEVTHLVGVVIIHSQLHSH